MIPQGLFHAKRMRDHHFTSLSITHNYLEGGNQPGELYALAAWQNESADRAVLEREGLRYDPAWLTSGSGGGIQRSVFEYVRDYLGYYLRATSGGAALNGRRITITLNLLNYGFAAPLGLADIRLVLLDAGDEEAAARQVITPNLLQPGTEQTLTAAFTVPGPGTYRAALSARSVNGAAARLANDTGFVKGYNILGEIHVE
jgi:hypothetical protein